MSADNGIYILRAIDNYKSRGRWLEHDPFISYRVAYVQGIDQLTFLEKHQPYNVGCYLRDIFKDSRVYSTKEEALQKAESIAKAFDYLEHGIQMLDTQYVFYQ